MRKIHQIRHLVLIMMMSCLSLSVFAQIEPNAIYNYYNNDSFDAFLNLDVDSIKYSNIDIYGKEHLDIVTQEIWTQDSVYRIPLSNIDSICFRAPEIKLRDSVFLITAEHIPYILKVDTLSLSFDSSIPGTLLPEIGQVVINDMYDEPLSMYTLQLSAYQIPLEDIGLKILGRRVIWLKDDGTYEIVPIDNVTAKLRNILA